MKTLLYILLIGISTLISCSGSPDPLYPRYTTFPDEKTVTTQEITIDSVFFRYPYRVSVKDSIAIIMDLHNDNHYFYSFTYPDWKPIAPFGKLGEGPEEMLSAEMFQFCSSDSIWTLDANRMQITRWAVSPAEKTVSRVEEITLDKSLVRSLDFYRTDSAFLITDYQGDFRYNKVSHNGKPINKIGKIPTETNYKQDIHPALAQAWRSFTDYNPQNGIYAMATQLGETLEIYNLKNQTHNIIYGPGGEPQFKEKGGEGIPIGIKGFMDIQVTDRYIYTVFDGMSWKERDEFYQRGEAAPKGGHYLYVFDTDGNPVRKYTLDNNIFGIYINEATNTCIATCVESDNPILTFKL